MKRTATFVAYSGETTGELLAYSAQQHDLLVRAFEQGLQRKVLRTGERSLSKEERTVLAVRALDREVNNGGYDQFFRNSSQLSPIHSPPCFPSYPSNHGSGSNGGAEVLRRLYGESGHLMTISNPGATAIALQYTSFKQITDDISDARVDGGIHFRTDQDAGGRLGRAVGTAVYKNNLRPMHDDD